MGKAYKFPFYAPSAGGAFFLNDGKNALFVNRSKIEKAKTNFMEKFRNIMPFIKMSAWRYY